MCTCIELTTRDHYFGRNLDLEQGFGHKVVITPRNHDLLLCSGKVLTTRYAMIGMAATRDDRPLYAEAANERGLAMAGLYFPGSARYFPPDATHLNLAAHELIPWFLGRYASVAELRDDLSRLRITDVPAAPDLPVAALHWMLCDDRECLVLEQMQDGLRVSENDVGVLTNNPPFAYHRINLDTYLNLTPRYPANRFAPQTPLHPYGLGMGAVGLPGDSSPASRFVRAAFHRLNSRCEETEPDSVAQFFHLLDAVAVARGMAYTADGRPEYTLYSSCINTTRGVYYYKTYENSTVTAVPMTEAEMSAPGLSVHPLHTAPSFTVL